MTSVQSNGLGLRRPISLYPLSCSWFAKPILPQPKVVSGEVISCDMNSNKITHGYICSRIYVFMHIIKTNIEVFHKVFAGSFSFFWHYCTSFFCFNLIRIRHQVFKTLITCEQNSWYLQEHFKRQGIHPQKLFLLITLFLKYLLLYLNVNFLFTSGNFSIM